MKRLCLCACLATLVVAANGCRSGYDFRATTRADGAGSGSDVSPPESGHSENASEMLSTPALEDPLDLERALALADEFHPDLRAARARLEAATGRAMEAGLWTNPQLQASMDAAPFEGKTTGDAEYIVGASQDLPVGGRLGAAAAAARAEERRRSFEIAAARRRVHTAVRDGFSTLLYLEQVVTIERRRLEAAEAAVTIAGARVTAGEGIPEEVSRAELEAERLRLELENAEVAREEARIRLAESMGRPGVGVRGVEGDLYTSLDLPGFADLLEHIERHPELLAAGARMEESEALLRLEELRRIPDVNLGFAYHRFEQTATDAFDVGFGIPLPLFSRNEGAIAEARGNLEAARAEARSSRASLEARLRVVYHRLRQVLRSVSRYREELVPRAEAMLASAEARYRAGDASLAEVLPIRRDVIRLELESLQAARQLGLYRSELEELTVPRRGAPSGPRQSPRGTE